MDEARRTQTEGLGKRSRRDPRRWQRTSLYLEAARSRTSILPRRVLAKQMHNPEPGCALS